MKRILFGTAINGNTPSVYNGRVCKLYCRGYFSRVYNLRKIKQMSEITWAKAVFIPSDPLVLNTKNDAFGFAC